MTNSISKLWKTGTEIMFSGDEKRFWEYLREIRAQPGDHEIVSYLLEEYYFVKKHKALNAMRVAKKVISKTSDPRFLGMAYSHLAWALRIMGNPSGSAEAARKSLEISQRSNGSKESTIMMAFAYYFADDLAKARETLPDPESLSGVALLEALHLDSLIELSMGNFSRAEECVLRILSCPDQHCANLFGLYRAFETLGMIKEGLGQVQQAFEAYEKSFTTYLERQNTYAINLANKIARLELFTQQDRNIDKHALKQAVELVSHSAESKIAIMEHKALSRAKRGDVAQAVPKILDAGDDYLRVSQSLESFTLHMLAGFLARKHDVGGFWRGLDRIESHMGFYRSYAENHRILADFTKQVVVPLLKARDTQPIVRIRMFGGFEVQGPVPRDGWKSQKALRLLKYLLLNENRGLQIDYLCWLIWPRANPSKTVKRLYVLISQIRKNLGPCGNLVVHSGGKYSIGYHRQLWVDVQEFQRAIRQAETISLKSLKAEKYIEALDIYRGELLPEDRYDKFIYEQRNHLHKRFREAFESAINLLLEIGANTRALELAKTLYLKFPSDEAIASVYIHLLKDMGNVTRARLVYQEFRKELWRAHRKVPVFKV